MSDELVFTDDVAQADDPELLFDSEVEVVDALPVVVEARPLEPVRQQSMALVAASTAVAATSFIAGVATAAVVGRQLSRRLGRPRSGGARALPTARANGELFDVLSSQSYRVDVHLLGRRS